MRSAFDILMVALLAGAPALSGCGSRTGTVPLDPVPRLNRVSMAVRGVRPSLSEIEAVQSDPSVLPTLVDQWLTTDAFGETIGDLHAELFLIRADTNYQLPVVGVLQDRGYNQLDVHRSTVEAPLELVREIVLEDRPYTEILTTDYTVANEVVAAIYGLPFDPDGPTWQHTEWTDGRPQSGLLSDSEMWRRHVSNAANFHRGRANFVSNTFLCEDIGGRDVFVDGGVDIADPLAVADAVQTNDGCVACHAVLDPMAAFFWGYKEQIQRGAVLQAYESGCEWDWSQGDPPFEPPRENYRIEHWCYPIKFYDVAEETNWDYWGLQPPAYFGHPAGDVRDLGDLIVEDPRFAACTVRNVASYLTQRERDELPLEWVRSLQGTLEQSDFSLRTLVREIVLSDTFAAARATREDVFVPGLQTIRPEQLSRALYELTGFRWSANADAGDCATASMANNCWGSIDLLNNDIFGVRSMMGGIDGYFVTHATHTPTPTQQLAFRVVAQEAAGFVVRDDFERPAAERRLLGLVEPGDRSEGLVRDQIARLYLRILAEPVGPRSRTVDWAYELWRDATRGADDPREGWRVVIAALLRDPAMVLY